MTWSCLGLDPFLASLRDLFSTVMIISSTYMTAQEISASPKLLGEWENMACLLCSLSHCIYTFLAWRPSTQSYQSTIRIIRCWICCWVCCQGCLLSKPEQIPRAHRSRVHLAVVHKSSRTLPRWAASVLSICSHRGVAWLMASGPDGTECFPRRVPSISCYKDKRSF